MEWIKLADEYTFKVFIGGKEIDASGITVEDSGGMPFFDWSVVPPPPTFDFGAMLKDFKLSGGLGVSNPNNQGLGLLGFGSGLQRFGMGGGSDADSERVRQVILNSGFNSGLSPDSSKGPAAPPKFSLQDTFAQIRNQISGEVTTNYSISLEEALNKQMVQSPQIDAPGWMDASRDQVRRYIDPDNYKTGIYKYQFLDLSAPAGVSEEELRVFLQDKGIFAGKEKVFINAATKYNIRVCFKIKPSV